jgi:hypothetical protein
MIFRYVVATPSRTHAYEDLATALRVVRRIREMGITAKLGALYA